jgi:putative membrane protein
MVGDASLGRGTRIAGFGESKNLGAAMSSAILRKDALSAALIFIGCAVGAHAQSPTTATPQTGASTAKMSTTTSPVTKLAGGDKTFVEKAAIGGLAEVELGNIAAQKASSDQVKQFAARMVSDHTKANDELKQIASVKGVQLPGSLDEKHKKHVDRLQKMSGAAFDKAYMGHMVEDHEQDVAEFKKEAQSGRDADVKGFASKTLSTLQNHLQLAKTTNDAVKKGAK